MLNAAIGAHVRDGDSAVPVNCYPGDDGEVLVKLRTIDSAGHENHYATARRVHNRLVAVDGDSLILATPHRSEESVVLRLWFPPGWFPPSNSIKTTLSPDEFVTVLEFANWCMTHHASTTAAIGECMDVSEQELRRLQAKIDIALSDDDVEPDGDLTLWYQLPPYARAYKRKTVPKTDNSTEHGSN